MVEPKGKDFQGRTKIQVLQSLISIKRHEQIGDTPYVRGIPRSEQEQQQCKQVLQEILEQERALSIQNYNILYHATTEFAYHYIDTQLATLEREHTYQKPLPHDTLLLRQPHTAFIHRLDLKSTFEEITDNGVVIVPINSQRKLKSEYLNYGVTNDHYHSQQLLSCAPSLTNNLLLAIKGEAALSYWLYNAAMSQRLIKVEDIIAQYPKIQAYALAYATKLQTLADDYKNASDSSTLLQLGLPREIIRNYAYTSIAYGHKANITTADGTTYSDIQDILDLITKIPLSIQKPSLDELQIRLYIQDSSIYNHLKVHSYNLDQKRLEEFKKNVQGYQELIRKQLP